MPSARPLTTGTPGGPEAAAQRVRHLAPVGARVRVPTIATAGSSPRPAEPLDPPHDEQDGRSVRQLLQRARIDGRVPAHRRDARLLEARRSQIQVAPVERLADVTRRAPRPPPPADSGSGSASSPDPTGGPIEQPGDARREHRDQQGTAQAGIAGAHPARADARRIQAVQPVARAPRRGRSPASPAPPSRSAIVRATRSTRSCARPLSSSRSRAASIRAVRRAVQRHLAAGQATVHVAVAERFRPRQPLDLALPGRQHASAHRLRPRAALTRSDQLLRRCLLDLADQVDAVEQRTAEPAHVPGELPAVHEQRSGGRAQGQRLQAATTIAFAGNSSARCPRMIVTRPSSSGWRSASTAARPNSGSSSRNRTPRCASVSSPGRGRAPPPTRP